MSRVYDDWERLVGAILKRVELRQIALCPSSSSSSSVSSDFRFDPSSQHVSANRVMNVLIKKANEKKKRASEAASSAQGKHKTAEPNQGGVPNITLAEETQAEVPSGGHSRKRRATETPISHGPSESSAEVGVFVPGDQPLRQLRPDSLPRGQVSRCRASFLEMYKDDLRIAGVEPTPLAGQVLRDMASVADAQYLESLGWSELVLRSNSATAEAALLNAEVTFRANGFRKQFMKDSRAFKTTSEALKQKVANLAALLEKETANFKRREEDMRLDFESQRLKFQNEINVVEVRLTAAIEETKKLQEDLTLAQIDAEEARAELSRGVESFKEAFLKSEEFDEIIGDKALSFLNVGFEGCVEQFRAAGYPSEGASSDFLNIDKILDSLPPDL